MSDEENFEIFDTCSNPNGHGHDYLVEVRVTGNIDSGTGMLISLPDLDRKVLSVIEELDYKRLDLEVPYFEEHVATGENITKYFWDKLKPKLGDGLVHLKLHETEKSCFEYFEEGGYPYER